MKEALVAKINGKNLGFSSLQRPNSIAFRQKRRRKMSRMKRAHLKA
jgi:hypothetical protein